MCRGGCPGASRIDCASQITGRGGEAGEVRGQISTLDFITWKDVGHHRDSGPGGARKVALGPEWDPTDP